MTLSADACWEDLHHIAIGVVLGTGICRKKKEAKLI